MSYKTTADYYIPPQYLILHLRREESTANFSEEIRFFLSHHPEFLTSKRHLEFLRYCYVHYINCDPASRDLPVQEKLQQAMAMARNFMGTVLV